LETNDKAGMKRYGIRNNRGVALLIALLVTALLIALIFEFAYGTRVSLRAAVNFRDSQRAYFLARAGVNYGAKLLADGKLQEALSQGEWTTVPIVSGGDTELRIRWEDEKGKINVGFVKNSPFLPWLQELFRIKQAKQDVLQGMADDGIKINLLTELHQRMSDEEYGRVTPFLTVYGDKKINLNTASLEVLTSMGFTEVSARMVIDLRQSEPFDEGRISPYLPPTLTVNKENFTSNTFTVRSFATVGDYTKQIEAVVQAAKVANPTVLYWRAL